MEDRAYEAPVASLLALGDPTAERERPDYLGLGLGREHVPELVRMATDPHLNEGAPESPGVWAPVHAWRALGELRAEEAVEPLLSLLDEEDDDWAHEELPDVFASIGPAAIPALARYLADDGRFLFGRAAAARALQLIGSRHPESRDACVEPLTRELARFRHHDPTLNAFLVGALVDASAREAAPLLRAVHEAGCVDTMVNGEWEAVCDLLGLDPDEIELPDDLAMDVYSSQLESPTSGFPRQAVEYAIANREAMTPRLLEMLEPGAAGLAAREDYYGHLFAMYLLAQFRERRALRPIVELVSGPPAAVEAICGDFIADGLDHVLASVANGDAGPIERLVENREANEWARGSAIRALATMAATGQRSYDDVVGYLGRLFDGALEREPSNVWTSLVVVAADLHAERLAPQIAKAFDENLVEEYLVGRDEIAERLASPPGEDPLAGMEEEGYRLVDDTIEEMEWWSAFESSEPPPEWVPLRPLDLGPGPPLDLAPAAPRPAKSVRAKKKAKSKRKSAKASKKRNRK